MRTSRGRLRKGEEYHGGLEAVKIISGGEMKDGEEQKGNRKEHRENLKHPAVSTFRGNQ